MGGNLNSLVCEYRRTWGERAAPGCTGSVVGFGRPHISVSKRRRHHADRREEQQARQRERGRTALRAGDDGSSVELHEVFSARIGVIVPRRLGSEPCEIPVNLAKAKLPKVNVCRRIIIVTTCLTPMTCECRDLYTGQRNM